MKLKIGFFGCGNMGAAIARGIRKHFSLCELYFYTPSKTRAESLSKELKGNLVVDLSAMPTDLDWYVLGFKPQTIDDFQFNFSSNAKVISVLAGTSLEKLKSKFNINKIARLMSNTPSGIGAGANLLFAGQFFNSAELNELTQLLNGLGSIYKMNSEDELDRATGFSGSGPGIIFELARIFEDELNKMTDNKLESRKIIADTFLGTAKLMQSNLSFIELRDQVTSKKGVTHEALMYLEDGHLQDIFAKAFQAAYKRTLELKK